MRLLLFFQERFGFTRTELTVVMLLTISLLIGTAIRHFRDTPSAATLPSYAETDSQFVRGARVFHDAVRQRPPLDSEATPHSPGQPLDINQATEAEFVRLPGIGPAIARRIIAYREVHGRFVSVTDLRRVRGIGPRTLDRIRLHVRVAPRSR